MCSLRLDLRGTRARRHSRRLQKGNCAGCSCSPLLTALLYSCLPYLSAYKTSYLLPGCNVSHYQHSGISTASFRGERRTSAGTPHVEAHRLVSSLQWSSDPFVRSLHSLCL